jgi:hypothetical protein
MIYELCIDFGGVEQFFDDAFAYFNRAKDNDAACIFPPIIPRIKTPTIFLICRQITAEVLALLPKKSITFHHGLMGAGFVDNVMSENLLRNVSSINIDVKGHRILKSNMFSVSWRGYMDLLADLANILRNGHRLKNLTIDLRDARLTKRHIDKCIDNDRCDFRNHLFEVSSHLRRVRGIRNVTIRGIYPCLARELKALMESKPVHFFDLPQDIRNRIYELSADYSDISTHLARAMSGWQKHAHSTWVSYPRTTTPSVLLINRQICREAHPIICNKALDLVCPSSPYIYETKQIPDLLRFVSAKTLQNIKHLSIRLETWEWIHAVTRILYVLKQKHSLKSFTFVFHDELKNSFSSYPQNSYPDNSLAEALMDLCEVRGVDKVTFEGDLPEVFTAPMAKIMESARGEKNLPRPMSVRGDGGVVEMGYGYE